MIFSKKVILNPSVINTGMTVSGNVESDGELNCDGVINGNVKALKVIIGINGKVNGNLDAEDVSIYGVVEGNITTDFIYLSATARVIGDITHRVFESEFGAYLEGELKKK